MIEKILKNTYVTPKVCLTQKQYNQLVSVATMKAKKIEECAREIYEKEGVVDIRFFCGIEGIYNTDELKFNCSCAEYQVNPSELSENKLFTIPQESRKKIAKHVKSIVESIFGYYFGEHLKEINEIRRLRATQKRYTSMSVVWSVVGWLFSVVLLIILICK